MRTISVRHNKIECRRCKSTTSKKVFYEIILWYPNEYYGREQDLLDKGYVRDSESFTIPGHSIDLSCFEYPEVCYVIAFIHLNHREPCTYLETVGERLLELTPQDKEDFFEVYSRANKKIKIKHDL